MRRRMYENRRDYSAAKKLRETFVDRPMSKVKDIGWSWPRAMDEIGVCTAVMYTSDKWKKIGEYEDYKHVSERDEEDHPLLIGAGFDPGMDVFPESTDLGIEMPDAFAELATILGIQLRLFNEDGVLEDQYWETKIAGAKLGAARLSNGETVLIVYTRSALCCLITGFEVEKDGIVR